MPRLAASLIPKPAVFTLMLSMGGMFQVAKRPWWLSQCRTWLPAVQQWDPPEVELGQRLVELLAGVFWVHPLQVSQGCAPHTNLLRGVVDAGDGVTTANRPGSTSQ